MSKPICAAASAVRTCAAPFICAKVGGAARMIVWRKSILPSRLEKPDSVIGVFNPEALLPGRDGLFSALGATVSRADFETVMDDYYHERGWDPDSGLQTREGLADLELEDLTAELAERGLLAE